MYFHFTAGSFPFAQCFICKETGHLSSSCPDNPKGLYPNGTLLYDCQLLHNNYVTGGGCKVCGSVEHLKANCPTKRKQTSSNYRVINLQLITLKLSRIISCANIN